MAKLAIHSPAPLNSRASDDRGFINTVSPLRRGLPSVCMDRPQLNLSYPKLRWLQRRGSALERESLPGRKFGAINAELPLQNSWTCNHCTPKESARKLKHLGNSSDSRFRGSNSILRSYFSVSSSKFYKHSYLARAAVSTSGNEPHVATNAAATLSQGGLLESADRELMENSFGREDLAALLLSKLPSHPKVHRGHLQNGLCYVILPNKVPTNRFEAHMEMHVGSVDEEEHEQGIAHMIEHVIFLGSKKREKLLGTGARSNAYTDFHHTVFHVHSPVIVQGSEEPLLPLVLEALHEIAFKPKFLESRVEKERRAILSELQMMNTIEYRVDCQLLQQLHSENKLGYRFPIGLEEQIKKWDVDTIRAFHERWYFPANATLYIVGDIESVGKCIEQIESVFGKIPAGCSPFSLAQPSVSAGPASNFQTLKLEGFVAGSGIFEPSATGVAPVIQPVRKERHAVRPPVTHEWSVPRPAETKEPFIFQHELLQNFSMSLFFKKPVQKVLQYSDLRDVLMRRIVLSALQFHINTRYKSANPPFTAIELDHSDSGREGCVVTTLTVTAEPKNWRAAVKVAVQEVRRLKEFGITKGELARYTSALLKDSEHLAAMIDSISSIDNLDFIMESDALGHSVMDQQQGHESLLAVAETVTLEDVNAIGASLLEYVADFGKPSAPLPAAIVVCVPKTIHQDGNQDADFIITSEDILAALQEGLDEPLIPEPELEVPKQLISKSKLMGLKKERKPDFVSLSETEESLKVFDEATGIVQRKLSNGIRVNYKRTKNEAKGGVMRLVVPGGRARETADASGAVAVGVRTLSEGGTVGGFSREQVELFCVSHLINCVLEADEEFLCMDFHFTVRDGGMRATFELLHMVLEHNVWLEDALDRAKRLYLTYYGAMPKSLERATAHRLMRAMLGGEERFIEPSPQALQKLTLPIVKDAVMEQLVTQNMEVSIVGDFTECEIEACLLDYLGTVAVSKANPKAELKEQPIIINPSIDPGLRDQKVFLKDTDERACAYIAGAAPNRWGFTSDGRDMNTLIQPADFPTEEEALALAPLGVEVIRDNNGRLCWKHKRHALYSSVAMTLLTEIINARLFTTVRDALGLTYDVSFEMSSFDRMQGGWFVISVTSTPAKINKAVEASLSVLKGLHGSRINQRELDRAIRTLMMRHESDSKDNSYWLGLLTHLQASSVSRKDVGCIRDVLHLYEITTVEDVYTAYNHLSLDDECLFTCIGIAGTQTRIETQMLEEDVGELSHPSGSLPHGRGMSTITRPTV